MENKLAKMYHETSKHGQYQILADSIANLFEPGSLKINSRYEKERFSYISSKINLQDVSLVDIGGNTGYFSFTALERGAKNIYYYEGNSGHFEFVKYCAGLIGVSSRFSVFNRYVDFHDLSDSRADVCFLLNVLHHIGDDYGSREISVAEARSEVAESLKNLSFSFGYMAFQLGYNWKGDKNCPLFTGGTKLEVIDFVKNSTRLYWDIVAIGVAEKNGNVIDYYDLSEKNIERDDVLGEFLNRPIFIMKSKSFM